MRGNAWQITAIVAILLVVVLIIPLVMMGRDRQTLLDQATEAKKLQSESAQKAATLEGENRTLKTLAVGKPDTSLDEVQKQYGAIMETALPGEDESTRTYHNALTVKMGELVRERNEHSKTSLERSQLESDFNDAKRSYEAVVAGAKADLDRAERARTVAQRQLITTKEEYDQKLKEGQDRQNASLARAERANFEQGERLRQVEIASEDIRTTNTYLSELLQDVRNPNVEYPAGKIISVDQQAGLAIINLGWADGLLVRTMFSVYHSSVIGLTFRTTPVGREPIYCDVCKREIARDASKASIEVVQILGPHRAQVRILDDILTDPIMTGDIIYSPIWKPGQNLRFALTAGMNLPGAVAGAEAVRRLIESNGGVVDCWIEEIVGDGEDHLKGSLSDLTNYVVVNESAARNLDPEVAKIQEELLESARNRAIKKISLGDLLNQMGWKNVTPVHVFGSQTFTPEMRVVPQHQGTISSSSGHVAPKFTPDNPNARMNAREATPVRPSSGTVSPLFNDKAPPPPSSSGRTSDLFRPRSPVVE